MPTDRLVELKALAAKATPGPWPWEYTGDGKRIVVGEGLVEGPNGYEVAEVYSDDCPQEVAEANAKLIAAVPAMIDLLSTQETTIAELVAALEDAFEFLGGVDDAVDIRGRLLEAFTKVRSAL